MVEYIKQTWEDVPSEATPIESARLDHMEQGIFAAQTTANEALAAVGFTLAWSPLLSNDPGTAIGLWTGGTGTWTYNTTYGINVSTTSASQTNTWSGLGAQTMRWRAMRATINFTTSASWNSWIGFGFASSASGWNTGDVSIGVNTSGLQWDTFGVGGSYIGASGIAANTDIDLYVIEDRLNQLYLVYVNGTFIYPVPTSSRNNQGRVVLFSQGMAGSFRNIWIWNGVLAPNLPQAV